MINRRRFLIAIGAGVLIATAALMPWKSFSYESTGNSLQDKTEQKLDDSEPFSLHENIITTVFWVGEEADPNTNDNIHNISSIWVEHWDDAYGGIDDPNDRCGFKPCGFEPKENAFYFALPFSEYGDGGLKPASELKVIPWYNEPLEDDESILKNRWVKIIYQDKTVYAQWEDSGPFGEDDAGYVFGMNEPKDSRAGLDISPAAADYLGIDGRGSSSWQFVEESEVPAGPWKEVITTSGPLW